MEVTREATDVKDRTFADVSVDGLDIQPWERKETEGSRHRAVQGTSVRAGDLEL